MKKITLFIFLLILAANAYAYDDTFLMKNLIADINKIESMTFLERKEALRNYAKLEAFILYSIKQAIGQEEFDKRIASITEYGYWGNILKALDDNNSFFDAYFKKKKVKLTISDSDYIINRESPAISFTLKRENGPKELIVGYKLKYKSNSIEGSLVSKKDEKQSFIIPVELGDVELFLDSNYEIYREYSNEEAFFNIAQFIDSKELILIYDDEKRRKELEEVFSISKSIQTDNLKFDDIKNKNIIIDGFENRFSLFFADSISKTNLYENYFNIIKNPLGFNHTILILNNSKFKGYNDLIKHYKLNDQAGILIHKRERDNAITFKKQSIEDILKKDSHKVIFVGETHTNYAHHLNQLEIIDFLNKSGKKVAIALEMFPTDSAPILKAFVNNEISQEEMLKQSNYFSVWGYDYSLYAPILQYARQYKLDLVPLNISKDKIYKIASGEIDSLKKSDLPERMNVSNEEYTRRLELIYNMHPPKTRTEKRRFEEFVLSQNIWDEYMASSLLNYTKNNKSSVVVVLAGSGHLNKSSGIPLRYNRIGGEKGLVIAMDSSYLDTTADIFLETREISAIGAPKLGIITGMGEKPLNGIFIDSIEKESVAENGGLKAKDILLKCNDYILNDLNSLKYMLFVEGYGAILKCKIKRNNKILDKTLILRTKLEKK